MCTQTIFICTKCPERLDGAPDKCQLFGTKGHQPTFPRKILEDVNLCPKCHGHPELGATIRPATNEEIMSSTDRTVARTRCSGGMNPETARYPKRDRGDIVMDRSVLLERGRSQKARGGLQRLVGSLRRTKTDQVIQRSQGSLVRQVSTDNIRDRDASLDHILTRSTSLPSYRPRHRALSRDLEASTANTKWKGVLTEVGKEETIFEEPESVDMGWLNEYGEMTPPASVWVSTSEEETDHDARLSQGPRKSSNTSRSRRSEDQRAEDVRRSKDSGMSDYSQRSRVNLRRSQDSRMSDESLRSAQARIAAEKWVEKLRIADEILARVRNGQGYRDFNLL